MMGEEATTLVILGATGDLSLRKLMPLLFNLWRKGRLPQGLRILGFALEDYSDDEFRGHVWRGTRESGQLAAQRGHWEQHRLIF